MSETTNENACTVNNYFEINKCKILFQIEISHVIQHDLCFHLFICLVFDLVMSELNLNCFKMLKLYLFPIPNFHCGLRLLVATVSMYTDSCFHKIPQRPAFLQDSFSYFNSLLCT